MVSDRITHWIQPWLEGFFKRREKPMDPQYLEILALRPEDSGSFWAKKASWETSSLQRYLLARCLFLAVVILFTWQVIHVTALMQLELPRAYEIFLGFAILVLITMIVDLSFWGIKALEATRQWAGRLPLPIFLIMLMGPILCIVFYSENLWSQTPYTKIILPLVVGFRMGTVAANETVELLQTIFYRAYGWSYGNDQRAKMLLKEAEDSSTDLGRWVQGILKAKSEKEELGQITRPIMMSKRSEIAGILQNVDDRPPFENSGKSEMRVSKARRL